MTSAVVTVDGLTRRFGSRRGVTGLSFEVRAGQVFGFLGPNGAGKSTTIRLLLGMYRADSGTMSVLGHDPGRDAVALHRRVGYLPGELALHPRLTGAQHLAAFARARGMASHALRDELVERFAVELDRPVRTLSKGNRQKIGLVLAFMHRPELLVLDEPTSGLDPLLQDEFARLVRETTADGRTVFLSSHELDEVQRLADQVAIIRDGAIVVTDTIEGLRRAAPRTIVLRFDGDADAARFTGIDGTEVTGTQPHSVALSVSGPLAPVLRIAADLGAVDMTARPADLEELFLRYYRHDRQEAR
ncbi:MAG TPA: ABC transporter ATP-binding protein [Streptosporangiaceae bacterium]|nr:ABC transporter ATP-binding protein [Streptosporangiaceae bacterium]